MFVAPYPEWVSSARFGDGSVRFFDGAKDLFRFLADVPRHAPGHVLGDLQDLTVTDYYEVRPLDARTAWYVLGSDVAGPMGAELVPHATREAAEEFRLDHRGARILRFQEVDATVLAELD